MVNKNEIEEEILTLSWEEAKTEVEHNENLRDFAKAKIGENILIVDKDKPIEKHISKEYGEFRAVSGKLNGKDSIIAFGLKNPIYREIALRVPEGKTTFRFLRMGEGKLTKYSLIEVN